MGGDGQVVERQNVSMYPAQWAVVREEMRRLGIGSVSAALRVIVTQHQKKREREEGVQRS